MSNKKRTESVPLIPPYKGAGVLLYDIVDQKLVFLLGKEYSPDDPQREKYCEFGGNAKKNEDPLSTALRELDEEGMGFLKANATLLSIRSERTDIIESYVSLEPPNCYYTFLMRYPYSSELVEKFNSHFEQTPLKTKLESMAFGLFEKSCLRWWTLDEIINGRLRDPREGGTDRIKPQTEILFHQHLIKILEKRWPEECAKLRIP